MSKDTLPKKIVECLTPASGPVSRSANEILSILNSGDEYKAAPLSLKDLRPRLSEMKKKGIISKTESDATNGKGRRVSAWKLAEATNA